MSTNSGTGVVVLLVFGGLFSWGLYRACSSFESPGDSAAAASDPAARAKQERETEAINAWVMAQEFVKDQLKSPGSADFGSAFRDYQKPIEHVQMLGDKKYLVTGWVDAQNAFGAKLRSDFSVTIQDVGNERWKVLEGPILMERQ